MGTAGQSITLANSIIGVGILAMPFCFQQCGVLLATLILLSMGLISRLCCYFLLKSALLARRRNFEFLAFHVFGSAGKLAVEVGIIGFLMGTCIAYFVVVGDLGPQIIAKLFNINQSDILRTSIMVIVSLVCVLPLGLLRNVDSLSNVSAATIGFYLCLVMKVITEAASQLLTGDWHTRMELWKPSGVLQCVPIFSMALFCQTQLFEIFESLPTLSLEKMNVVTKNALNICTSVYFTLGVFGYIAFCSQQISGNILMSLSPTLASDVIKLGFVMSLAFSFPLIIFPCRASLYSLLYKKVHSSHHDHIINHSIPESSFRCITVAIIAVTLFISLMIPNIELVLGLVGSTIGVLICIVFPSACFVHVTFKNTNERVLAKATVAFGLIVMILGTYANLQAAESQKDKYDDRYITQERIDKIVEDFFEKMDKSDVAGEKPIAKNDPRINEIKIDENALVESEVQPPNPVPPESQSNEKPQKQEVNIDSKLNVLAVPEKEPLDKVSEAHPKNLNKLNEVKNDNVESNVEKNKMEMLKEEKTKTASNEENMKKQQQLIETIKQHGEEQKELIKEQKEILDEIMKTKKEQQNEDKNEIDSLAAKRIAVESIKKIADMAIQSLGGVSEKPADQVVVDNKVEHIEKLADKAVQEIAKKAVETIEAIKEINVKADAPIPKLDNQPVAQINPVPGAIQNNAEIKSNVQSSNANLHPSNYQNVNNNLPVIPSVVNPQAEAVVLSNAAVENKAQSVNNNDQSIQAPNNNPQNVLQPGINVQQQLNVEQPAAIIQQAVANHQQPPANVQLQSVQQPLVNVQQPVSNVQQPAVNVQQFASNGQQSVVNGQEPAANVHHSAENMLQHAVNVQQPNGNAEQPAANIQKPVAQQPSPNVNQPVAKPQQSAVNVNQLAMDNQQSVVNVQEPARNIQQPSEDVKPPVVNLPNLKETQNNLPKQPVENVAPKENNVNKEVVNKQQPHLANEPLSNKQGEVAQKKQPDAIHVNDNMIKNIPLPLSKDNINQQNANVAVQEPPKPNHVNKNHNNGAIENNIRNEVLNRQKREVVDCTEKTTLKPEDKQICEKLVNVPQIKTDVKDDFPKIDMNDIALPKSLPMDVNLIYHLRSLKSYDVKDKNR